MTQEPPTVDGKALVAAQKAEWKAEAYKKMKGKQKHPLKMKADPEHAEAILTPAAPDPTDILCQLYETTGCADSEANAWVVDKALQANQFYQNQHSANGLLAVMAGIDPQNPIEGLLAAQMATCHNLAMDFTRRAMVEGQTMDAVDRHMNRAAKMMRMFTSQMEALEKLRNKGQ